GTQTGGAQGDLPSVFLYGRTRCEARSSFPAGTSAGGRANSAGRTRTLANCPGAGGSGSAGGSWVAPLGAAIAPPAIASVKQQPPPSTSVSVSVALRSVAS